MAKYLSERKSEDCSLPLNTITSMTEMKSWVWNYATRVGERAFCDLCRDRANNEFSCRGGSTGAIGKHLKVIHLKSPLQTPDETFRPPPLQRASVSVRSSSVLDARSVFDSPAGEMPNEFSDDTVDTASVKVMDEDIEDPESDIAEPTATTPARARLSPAPPTKFRTDTDVALIECVRARTVLYDPGHSRYMDVQLKNNIWNKIGKQLRVNPTACKSRWSNIRDNYRKTLRRRGPSTTNNYKFAKMLSFMDHYYKGKLLPAADDSSSNDENEDEGKKNEVTKVTIKVAPSDTEDQESAIDEFERSSVSVSGNQVPGSSDRQGQAVDAFLAAISPSLKGLSPYHLSMAKAEIFATVHKYELKGIVEGGWETRDINPLP